MHTWLIQDKCFIVHSFAIQMLQVRTPDRFTYSVCVLVFCFARSHLCRCATAAATARRRKQCQQTNTFLVQFSFSAPRTRDSEWERGGSVCFAYVLGVRSQTHTPTRLDHDEVQNIQHFSIDNRSAHTCHADAGDHRETWTKQQRDKQTTFSHFSMCAD